MLDFEVFQLSYFAINLNLTFKECGFYRFKAWEERRVRAYPLRYYRLKSVKYAVFFYFFPWQNFKSFGC